MHLSMAFLEGHKTTEICSCTRKIGWSCFPKWGQYLSRCLNIWSSRIDFKLFYWRRLMWANDSDKKWWGFVISRRLTTVVPTSTSSRIEKLKIFIGRCEIFEARLEKREEKKARKTRSSLKTLHKERKSSLEKKVNNLFYAFSIVYQVWINLSFWYLVCHVIDKLTYMFIGLWLHRFISSFEKKLIPPEEWCYCAPSLLISPGKSKLFDIGGDLPCRP